MSTTQRSIVAGIFSDEQQAEQAMADLQSAGFTDNQIRYSVHKGGSGILDALKELGFGQDEANYYNSEFLAGRTVVTVKDAGRQQEAADILQRNGAYDASRMSQTSNTTNVNQAYTDNATSGTQNVQLKAEQLQASKQQVQAGEVDLRKEVVAEQQTIDVPVTHEEVYVERRAGSGQVSDTPIGEGETVRVPVSAEQVNASKQTVTAGEVSLGKRAVQENQQVTDTVRHEEARVEQQGDVNIAGNDSNEQAQ
jgi:uncharacterized protein (TIGR02271 family)